MTLNTESDTLWFVRFGASGAQILWVVGTSSKNSIPWAVPGVGLMLIAVVVSLQFEF